MDEMTDGALVAFFSEMLQAAREGRISVNMFNRTIEPTMKSAHYRLEMRVKNETELSGLSSLVKEACAIDLKERLKIAAQAPAQK